MKYREQFNNQSGTVPDKSKRTSKSNLTRGAFGSPIWNKSIPENYGKEINK